MYSKISSLDDVDGYLTDAVNAARSRWKAYADAGHDLTYWRQTDNGRWQKKDV